MKLSRPLFLVPLLLLPFLESCSGSRNVSQNVTGQVTEAIPWEHVRVYGVLPENTQPVADLFATSSGTVTTNDSARLDAVVVRLKKAAAKLGANGILLGDNPQRPQTSVTRVAGAALDVIPHKNKVGGAIVGWLKPSGRDYEFNAKAFRVPLAPE